MIYNSEDTRRKAEKQLAVFGRIPPGVVSKLGTIRPGPDPRSLPPDLPPDRPYFITVGTIEPRKNHAFLLDMWERMGPDAPPLLICGSRGWENADVFARLNALRGKSAVRELPGLADTAVAALVQKAAGALYPTHAEGFGLALVEARALGARVLCNDLAVFQEILGDQVTFVSVKKPGDWLNKVREWEKDQSVQQKDNAFEGFRWSDNFKTVLRLKW
ncbi:MAG: glycosyltransferase [Sulfitobacter sp.]|nr:glycosyltransferase [Sulfitobacter sp.]